MHKVAGRSTVGTFLTEVAVRKMLIDLLDEDENVEAVARGTDILGKPIFAVRTDKRGLLVHMTRSFKVKDKDTMTLAKLDKKLRRLALVQGTFLSPPGEPAFRNEKEKDLYEAEKTAIKRLLEPDESIMTLGLARDTNLDDANYYYVAFTDRRVMIGRLFDKREIVDTQSLPLSEIESWDALSGENPVPLDVPIISSQDQRLHFKLADGSKRKLLVTDLFGFRREDSPD